MKEAVQAEIINGVPFRDAVMKFTRTYRASPHCATGVGLHAPMHGVRQDEDTPASNETNAQVKLFFGWDRREIF